MTRSARIILPIALIAAGVACSSETPEGPPPCDTPTEATTVTMGDFFYEPTCLQASNGTTLEVINEGDAPHTYTVKDTDVESNLDAHDSGDMTIEGLTVGTVYRVVCIYHSNMTAALKVV